MKVNSLQELAHELGQIKLATDEATQAAREALLNENQDLVELGHNDSNPDLKAYRDDNILNCGELGRILYLLPSLQQYQTMPSFGFLARIVDRGCQIACNFMHAHTATDTCNQFALNYAVKLTLCTDPRYFINFVAELPANKRMNFIRMSNKHITKRFVKIAGLENIWTIAANFSVKAYLSKPDQATYIEEFINILPNMDFTWLKAKKFPDLIFSTPNKNHLIDLLAIIPEKNRLAFAIRLIHSTGDHSEYIPMGLSSLEKMLTYLNHKEQQTLTQEFKKHIP